MGMRIGGGFWQMNKTIIKVVLQFQIIYAMNYSIVNINLKKKKKT